MNKYIQNNFSNSLRNSSTQKTRSRRPRGGSGWRSYASTFPSSTRSSTCPPRPRRGALTGSRWWPSWGRWTRSSGRGNILPRIRTTRKTETHISYHCKIFTPELRRLGTPFFGGEKPDMTDFMIWPWIERLPIIVR